MGSEANSNGANVRGGFRSTMENFLYSGDKKHVFAGIAIITVVFGAPWYFMSRGFRLLWNTVKSFLDPKTAAKIQVVLIGYSADVGYLLGDTKGHCSTFKGTRTRAVIVFVLGFRLLDLANNTVHGPARALLADLSGPDQCNSSNAVFCSWMAVGNILGFSAGASGDWHRWFPFLTSRACCEACGNLKAAFLVAVVRARAALL